MIYPEINIQDWIDRYPALAESLIMECDCGAATKGHRPVRTKRMNGVVTDECVNCGSPGAYMSTPIDEEMEKHAELIRSVVSCE